MTQARKRLPTPAPAAKRKPPVKAGPGSGLPDSLPKPNVDDPLSEPTRNRRIWAAYLAAGLTRRQFASALGTNYHTVCRWDAGVASMSLDMLERAAPLLQHSIDELIFGRRGVPAPQPMAAAAARETPLTETEIRALLDRQRVDAVVRAAFGEHSVSPAGRYQTFSAAYVEAWCAAYAATGDGTQALQAAVNARAVTDAAVAGVSAVTSDVLRNALRGGSGGKS